MVNYFFFENQRYEQEEDDLDINNSYDDASSQPTSPAVFGTLSLDNSLMCATTTSENSYQLEMVDTLPIVVKEEPFDFIILD